MPDSAQITAWLTIWRNGETVHIQLRQIAANLLQRERANHTLEPNALVNELCVRLLGGPVVSYQDRAHFFAIAAQTMRRILIDHVNCPSESGPDFDFASSAILISGPDGRDLLLAGQKSGMVYALDPAKKGQILWQTRVGQGGTNGGVQWGMAADSQQVYASVSDVAGT